MYPWDIPVDNGWYVGQPITANQEPATIVGFPTPTTMRVRLISGAETTILDTEAGQ